MPKEQPLDIESTFAQLESTIHTLESEESTLHDSMEAFEQGVGLIKQAQKTLQDATQRVNLLVGEGDNTKSTPFEGEND